MPEDNQEMQARKCFQSRRLPSLLLPRKQLKHKTYEGNRTGVKVCHTFLFYSALFFPRTVKQSHNADRQNANLLHLMLIFQNIIYMNTFRTRGLIFRKPALTRTDTVQYTAWFKKIDSISYVCISWTIHGVWMIYITFERGGPKFSNTNARALA